MNFGEFYFGKGFGKVYCCRCKRNHGVGMSNGEPVVDCPKQPGPIVLRKTKDKKAWQSIA